MREVVIDEVTRKAALWVKVRNSDDLEYDLVLFFSVNEDGGVEGPSAVSGEVVIQATNMCIGCEQAMRHIMDML